MPFPAVLLAAGEGTRLRPITEKIPKCMVPIGGQPLIGLWLKKCRMAGFSPVIVNTHYLAGQAADCVASLDPEASISHEDKLLGTGGTLLAHKDILRNGTFFVAHADNLSFFRMDEFIAAHKSRPEGCLMTMLLFRTPTPETCGIVEIDQAGVAQKFHEKVPGIKSNLANGAVYLMEPEVLSILESCANPNPDISLDLIPLCLGRVFTFDKVDYHLDIGTPESYKKACRDYASGIY